MNLEKEAYDKAILILEMCKTPHGFYAAYPGYDMVFARDSMIMSLGASLLGGRFKKVFGDSLKTLGEHQSRLGQIPNAVDKYSKRKPHVDYKSIDSTLWWIIGHYRYKEIYKDASLFKKHKKKIEKALVWLKYQDISENGMLEQLPTTDWQDAFPHRYGQTINTQALYYKVLNLVRNKKEAGCLKKIVNHNKEEGLWDGSYYLSYRWKNHNKYREVSDWFDPEGNVLAVLYGLADKGYANKIFSYIKNKGVDKPYPLHASVFPPITKKSKHWNDYFLDSDAGTPWHYINSGIWTYVGGFYVCTLVKYKKFSEAKKQLKKLAEANMKDGGGFREWLDGKTGRVLEQAKSGYQGWNAAMYIAAYLSVQKKRCLI